MNLTEDHMKLTKVEMLKSLQHHFANKIPSWPPELVTRILEVVHNYEHDSYETILPPVPLYPTTTPKRTSRKLREGVFQRGY